MTYKIKTSKIGKAPIKTTHCSRGNSSPFKSSGETVRYNADGSVDSTPAVQQATESGSKKYAKDQAKKQAVKTASSFGSKAGRVARLGGRLMGAAGIVSMGVEAYKKGQETSGGRVGYEKNPNYDPTKEGSKHGGRDSNAQFVPKGDKKHTDFWSDAKKANKENVERNEEIRSKKPSWNVNKNKVEKPEVKNKVEKPEVKKKDPPKQKKVEQKPSQKKNEKKKGWDFNKKREF